MAKLIVVTREQVKASQSKLEALMAKAAHWQEEKKQTENYIAAEKARLDAEFAAMQEKELEGLETKG
jgi:uncharacterized protein YqcC (DUF446 family)